MKRIEVQHVDDVEMNDFVVGVLRVNVIDAINWLGGSMMSVNFLFPPPVYDHGYRQLLEYAPKGNIITGDIQHIGA